MEGKEYDEILEYLQGKCENNQWKLYGMQKKAEKFEVIHGNFYKKKKNGELLRVIQEQEKDAILFMTHNHTTGAHLGIDATYGKIRERYYWKGMIQDITAHIKYCDTCQRRGKKGGTGWLNPIKVEQIFERIGIDFVGPLPRTR